MNAARSRGSGSSHNCIDRPRHSPSPVHVVHHGRRVDAVARSEDVLHRNDDEIGARGEECAQQCIAQAIVKGILGAAAGSTECRPLDRVSPFVEVCQIPPLGQRLGVVRRGRSQRHGGKPPRIAEGLTDDVPFTLPSEHLVARHVKTRQRLAHEVRDAAEIFGNDLRAE